MIPIFKDPKRFVAALNKTRLATSRINGVRLKPFSTMLNKINNSQSDMDERLNPEVYIPRIDKQLTKPVAPASLNANDLIGPRESNWWTGKQPAQSTIINNRPTSVPFLSLAPNNCTRKSLQKYFDNTWTLTESLFASLQGQEAFMVPPAHNLRHPLIFYYGHPAALYVNKLRVASLLKEPIDPYFEVIFETGVDEMSWDDMSKNQMPWPSVSAVHAYRKKVYNAVSELIASLSDKELAKGITPDSPLWALALSFEHERIHIETSSVLINELPLKYLKFPNGLLPPYYPSPSTPTYEPKSGIDYPKNNWLEIEAQTITLGKQPDEHTFGWDNEYGSRTYSVPAFRANQFKISNGEYLEFVKDGGYSKAELWTEAGWKWRSFRNAKWPQFWQSIGPQGLHHFELRVLTDVIPMPWSWPVTVNLHESVAFANWAAKKTGRPLRVMTELEHNAIRDDEQRSRDSVVKYSSSMSMAEAEGVNSNLSYSSMNPVDAFRPNKRGAYDVFGNAWEWTLDYFSPLENFSVHRLYEDFSTPCFDGLHHVIQGSSFISTGNEASIYSRYHFRAHFLQHASFRLVDPLDSPLITSDTDAPGPYVGSYPFRQSREGLERRESERMNRLNDTDTLLARHFGSHPITGSPDIGYGDIAKTIIETFQGVSGSPFHQANVLEVGSGAGGLTVHLAANGRRVLSTDHEERHIETARVAAAQRSMSIDFRRTDPLCLPAELQGFDVVVLNDVIDRLAAPGALLGRLAGPRGLLRPGGLLAVLSAFQWDAERTPRELWIAGDRPADSLAARLGPDFRLVGESKQQLLWWESSSDIGGKQLALLLFVRETN